jgi:hypothetical protein
MRPIFTVITDRSALAFGLKPNRSVQSHGKISRFSELRERVSAIVNGELLDQQFSLSPSNQSCEICLRRRFNPAKEY